MTDTGARFEMRGILKRFGATLALENVDFAVHPGEVCALVGQNGAGKSTLMGILSGVIRPDSGAMFLDGAVYSPRSPLDARQSGVAMIHQDLSLAPHLSVEENIVLGMEPARRLGFVRRKEARRRANAALRRLRHAEISPTIPATELSAAEQQLVEIARALANDCRVLVLDEPTSSIAHSDVERLFGIITHLKRQGHAIVYISHFIDEVKKVADRFVVLRDGRNAGGGDVRSCSHNQIVEMMVGRSVDNLYPRTVRRRSEPLLEVAGLGSSAASFVLHRGEVLGIAGLVGAGRSQLLRGIFGLDPVRSGRVRLAFFSGRPSPDRCWKLGMGMVSEDRKGEGLAHGLGIADNLTLPSLSRLGPGIFIIPSRRNAAARQWIKRLGIRCRNERQAVSELSGGNQQKVALARLLHADVDVLILDEPTRGIDIGSKAEIYELIDRLVAGNWDNRRRSKAVLIVSSYFPELVGLCDRIAVMHRGQLGQARPIAEIDERELLLEATAG
jgi:ribose transport system ATP-binding protein